MRTRTGPSLILPLLWIAWLAFPSVSLADIDACVKIEGSNQGGINDGPACGNGEDGIEIFGFGHNIVIPTDPQSGQPSGQRVHQPVRILKAVTKSSPLLNNALVTGERLTRVEIRFYRTNGSGQREHYYTILLEDATLINITTSASNSEGTVMQELLSMTYRKITWTNEVEGTSASDDWRSAVTS